MKIFFVFIVVVILITDLLLIAKLNEKMEHIEDVLTDMDIVYYRLKRMTTDIRDVFIFHQESE